MKSLEVAKREEETPDAETETLKAEMLKLDDEMFCLPNVGLSMI